MKKKLWICVSLLLVIPGLLMVTSCAKKGIKADDHDLAQTQEEIARQRALDEKQRQSEGTASTREIIAARNLFMNEDIYFDFDRSDLKTEAREILKRKAEWLRNNSGQSIIIEGHCDERGTNEYNLALGDRRAQSAKNFLRDLGIAKSRLTTISYGEERPANPRGNENAWSKNRRAHFVLE